MENKRSRQNPVSYTHLDVYKRQTLYILCESVSARLREYGFICRTVQIGIRDYELHSIERQSRLLIPNRTAQSLFQAAYRLFKEHHNGLPVRGLSVRALNLEFRENEQLSLLPEISLLQKQEQLESALDSIRNRFGPFSVRRGVMLSDPQLSALDPKNDHIIYPESFLRVRCV